MKTNVYCVVFLAAFQFLETTSKECQQFYLLLEKTVEYNNDRNKTTFQPLSIKEIDWSYIYINNSQEFKKCFIISSYNKQSVTTTCKNNYEPVAQSVTSPTKETLAIPTQTVATDKLNNAKAKTEHKDKTDIETTTSAEDTTETSTTAEVETTTISGNATVAASTAEKTKKVATITAIAVVGSAGTMAGAYFAVKKIMLLMQYGAYYLPA